MKLYFHPRSAYSLKVLAALHEYAITVDAIEMDLGDAAAMQSFCQIYPLGKFPLLVTDDGSTVAESSIIIEYLTPHRKAGPSLIPTEALRVRYLDRVCDQYLSEPVGVLLSNARRSLSELEMARSGRARSQVGLTCDLLEEALRTSTWLAGDTFSLADCAALPGLVMLSELEGFGLAAHPRLHSYWRRLGERASLANVIERAVHDLRQLLPHTASLEN